MTENNPAGLRQNFLFAGLSEAQYADVLGAARLVSLEEEQHLFHQNDPARHFFLLQTGQIQLYRLSPQGEEKVIELIHPNQTFAEAVMFFKKNAYPVSAKAVIDSKVWLIDMAVFLQILHESTELCLFLLGIMSRRLHDAVQEIEQLSLHNATVRVIHLLLQSAPVGLPGCYRVEWQTPKQLLAARLSIRPETFSRILQQLSRRRLIAVSGKVVEVIDIEGLRQALKMPD
ncbi:MAG: Crp/Fnr family transcriptional regulator [Gammaproteobacteria bacterium HGW-Gammaproteobacteria-3]|nr:MAG: Crp/Fnr family transcriptional regulator [Gammaproteobacteria bacterium HGW-Gammaproteobacteria-3]